MAYSVLLTLHICGAIIGLLSGTAALIFRKGFRLHRAAGNVFFLVALAAAGGGLTYGWEAAHSATGLKEGYPPGPYLIFGSLSFWAAALDVRMLVRGGVSGAARIARHLWRMCVALLIAALSFFLGKQQHFPQAIRGSQILNVPMILILIVMAYWLIRVRITTAYKKA